MGTRQTERTGGGEWPLHLCCKATAVVAAALLLAGCGRPNKANILLRKQNQTLQAEIADLKNQRNALEARVAGLERQATTIPVLPGSRLERLFTVHGLYVNPLSGGTDLDYDLPGDEGLKLYVVPVDQSGEPLKSAGSFIIEAYDLADQGDQRIGRWEFDVEQARRNWHALGGFRYYVFTLPWQSMPRHARITIPVAFTDELTQRRFVAEHVTEVNLPPGSLATQPTAAGP